MLENVTRKVVMILVMLGISAALLLIPDKPFQLGLDLQGGTRLVYSFDFDEALERGLISPEEYQNRAQVIDDTIAIIRNRVDPTGTLEAIIRREGAERIVIELPGTLNVAGDTVASSSLVTAIDEAMPQLDLVETDAFDFPETGGIIEVGAETIRYDTRQGSTLYGLKRGHRGTTNIAHVAGESIELVSDDAIRQRIESLGDLSFQIVANAADYVEFGTDEATERGKLTAWAATNPGTPIAAFNRITTAEGPNENIEWFPYKEAEGVAPRPEVDRAAAVLKHTGDEAFTGSKLSRVYPSQDDLGYPAVGFEMQTRYKSDFGDFTESYEQRQMAIILNDEIASAPRIDERLPGAGIIRGQFTGEEVRNLITVLRSGSLSLKPRLEHEEVVGPTLGADYVQRGMVSGLVALGLVLAFMVFYYRRLGLFAAVALLLAFVMLMGGLAFVNATLTLPGIAGIILTVGMAVDANILIFDRIREEGDKGRNVKQAATTGFEKALSAILDANITTFLTALILYNIGTGPVRGFAVTLMIGILASVFAALVITRVAVHVSLTRGAKEFKVGTWMVKASYDFLSKTKVAAATSVVLILGGLTLFTVLPDQEKLGIDFTGGAEVVLRTNGPQQIDEMRGMVGQIPGDIGESATVKPLLDSAEGDGYTMFRVTFKTPAGQTFDEAEGGEAAFESEIKRSLGDVLLTEGAQVSTTDEGATAQVQLSLVFEETHSNADVTTQLGQAGLSNVSVQQGQGANSFAATATTTAGRTDAEILAQVKSAFRNAQDSSGNDFNLAQPIPSSSKVGPQVVGELRDKALLALAISLFATVLYIRVRFAEYSYGFAAVAAVFHDVLITLGVLALANHFGVINGEINLPMIAAFLTIIGYSLNDTIVIFDRVRENLPRMKGSMRDVLNASINQTLSRTILTSITTFAAVACLFAFNFGTGNVLESFSFAMMIGVLTGTYSTIFVANPLLLWLEERSKRNGGAEVSSESKGGGKKKKKDAAVPAKA